MKANPDKCHMLVSKNGSFVVNISKNKISNTKTERPLRSFSIICELSITRFLTYAKEPVTNYTHSLELHRTLVKIRK